MPIVQTRLAHSRAHAMLGGQELVHNVLMSTSASRIQTPVHLQLLALMCRDLSFAIAMQDTRVTERLAPMSTSAFPHRALRKRRVSTRLGRTRALVALVGRPIQMVQRAQMSTSVLSEVTTAQISGLTVRTLMGHFFVRVFQATTETVCSVPM